MTNAAKALLENFFGSAFFTLKRKSNDPRRKNGEKTTV